MSRSVPQTPSQPRNAAYFELRMGGFRVTADKVPVRLIATMSSAASGFVAWWLTR